MRKILVAAIALLVASSLASAAVVSVASIELQPGQAGTLNILVSGGEAISGAQAYAVIGSPAELGGTDVAGVAPSFVSGVLGPMWGAADNQFQIVDLGTGPNPLVAGNAAVLAAGQTTAANGVLFSFSVVAGSAFGDFAVNLIDVLIQPSTVPVEVQGGVIRVVPEPAAIALLGLGGLFLRRRHA